MAISESRSQPWIGSVPSGTVYQNDVPSSSLSSCSPAASDTGWLLPWTEALQPTFLDDSEEQSMGELALHDVRRTQMMAVS